MKRRDHPVIPGEHEHKKKKKQKIFYSNNDNICFPEYALVHRQLAKKFQRHGLGSAWMIVLEQFCKYTPEESVMIYGRKFIRNMTGNPTAAWPAWAYEHFKRLAKQIVAPQQEKGQPLILRGFHSRGQGLTTTLLAFIQGLRRTIPASTLPKCVYVAETGLCCEEAFNLLENKCKLDAKDNYRAPLVVTTISRICTKLDRQALFDYDLMFLDIVGYNGENALVVTHAGNLDIMGFPAVFQEEEGDIHHPINHISSGIYSPPAPKWIFNDALLNRAV